MDAPKSFKLWVFMILVVLGVLALALWLDLRHQTPSFTITKFSVPTSTDSKHPDIYITLQIKNPNKVYSIVYDYSVFTVKYGQLTLGQTQNLINPGFTQAKQQKPRPIIVSDHVEANIHQWEAFLKVITNSSKAILKAELKIGIRYHNLGHRSKQYNLTYQGKIKIGPDGEISGKKTVKLCKSSC